MAVETSEVANSSAYSLASAALNNSFRSFDSAENLVDQAAAALEIRSTEEKKNLEAKEEETANKKNLKENEEQKIQLMQKLKRIAAPQISTKIRWLAAGDRRHRHRRFHSLNQKSRENKKNQRQRKKNQTKEAEDENQKVEEEIRVDLSRIEKFGRRPFEASAIRWEEKRKISNRRHWKKKNQKEQREEERNNFD